jgi:hypothetical protein
VAQPRFFSSLSGSDAACVCFFASRRDRMIHFFAGGMERRVRCDRTMRGFMVLWLREKRERYRVVRSFSAFRFVGRWYFVGFCSIGEETCGGVQGHRESCASLMVVGFIDSVVGRWGGGGCVVGSWGGGGVGGGRGFGSFELLF